MERLPVHLRNDTKKPYVYSINASGRLKAICDEWENEDRVKQGQDGK